MRRASVAIRAVCLSVLLTGGCERSDPSGSAAPSDEPLRMVVMDPLAAPLACACVEGYAQRQYEGLAAFLESRIGRKVHVIYAEGLREVFRSDPNPPELIIGKWSVVLHDAEDAHLSLQAVAGLTDKDGRTDFSGLFVVRGDDPAKTIGDLKGYRLVLGPTYAQERHGAALAAMKQQGIQPPADLPTEESCNTAALAVVEHRADAAVISSYALALLEGCNTIDAGTLRVVGQTADVPFVTAFVASALAAPQRQALLGALLAVKADPLLLEKLESRDGFRELADFSMASESPGVQGSTSPGWPGWRGPARDGHSPHVPPRLPEQPEILWSRPLLGQAMAGVVVQGRYVIVADKGPGRGDWAQDIFLCLDAADGHLLWELRYDAPGEMDFTNSPRATPLIHEGRAYLLGAFGDLHCVQMDTGRVLWRKNVVEEFAAQRVLWGACSSPLIVDGLLIVNPGAPDASVAALDCRTGQVVWKSPGGPAAYSSFLVADFGGLRQLVGQDAAAVGGWDVRTGRRLWALEPPEKGDFNVPTPMDADGRLLLTSENNGTRLYDFDSQGRIVPSPRAVNRELAPDTITPVVMDGLVFGVHGGLLCLSAAGDLRELWSADDEAFEDYVTMIAGNGRLLIATVGGELLLARVTAQKYELISRLKVFSKGEVWSHPALVDGRLYIRGEDQIRCLRLPASQSN